MLFERKTDKLQLLEGYMNLNNILYDSSYIKDQIDEFEELHKEYHLRYLRHDIGYEIYDEKYIFLQRIEFLEKLIQENFGLQNWQEALKIYLISNRKDQSTFLAAGMTLGSDSRVLLASEIIINEIACKKAIEQLKSAAKINEILGNRNR